MDYSIRDAQPADLDDVLALNQSEVPHVGGTTMDELQYFMDIATYFRVAVGGDDGILAFLVGLAPGTGYGSLNYRWFCDRYDSFAYIDRVAVAARARRLGIAGAMYTDFEKRSRPWSPMLCCEVNLVPPNPVSMTYHERLGFSQAGTLETLEGAKKVAMLVKEIG